MASLPPTGTLLVFGLILVVVVLFVTERIPSDTTAVATPVTLVVFERWTGIGAADAISGFASPATVTIVAMYMLSEGVRRTGLVRRLGTILARLTGGSEVRVLVATVGTTGVSSLVGFLPRLKPWASSLHLCEAFLASASDQHVAAGDLLTVRTTLQIANRIAGEYGLRHRHRDEVTEDDLSESAGKSTLAEAVVPPDSRFVGETIGDSRLNQQFGTTVLAVRRGGDLLRAALDDVELRTGDTLLLQTTEGSVAALGDRGELIVTETAEDRIEAADPSPEPPLDPRTPVAVGILLGVIATAALGLLPIVIAALGGVVAMIVTGCLKPADAYDAVSWNVVFLLAGLIPLRLAMQRTGGDAVLAGALVRSAELLPPVAVLVLVYLLTTALANVITPVASVVLMIPIAVDTAARIGANELAFLLAAMFAAANAFVTPISYQTNLMVYGPGGYRFTDYLRVGGPLQLLVAVVTTLGLVAFWGLR
jgi:di/tricarboxylate transporter